MSQSSDLVFGSAATAVTVAGTRVPLAAGRPETVHVRSVTIKALSTNTGNIYIGNSLVSGIVGYVLTPGETLSISVEAEEWVHGMAINLNTIWLDADVSGEGVRFIYVRD